MVATTIASVTYHWPHISNDVLDTAVAIIKDHNSHYKHQEVKTMAWLVDRMILGKCWLLQDDIKARKIGQGCSGTGSGEEATWITHALPSL